MLVISIVDKNKSIFTILQNKKAIPNENIIYLELLRRGYAVYIGKVDEYEIDFVAINSKGIEYYQVAETVRNEETLSRELRTLDIIKDYYPKYLLTMDLDPETSYNGIRKKNVLDWLLEK